MNLVWRGQRFQKMLGWLKIGSLKLEEFWPWQLWWFWRRTLFFMLPSGVYSCARRRMMLANFILDRDTLGDKRRRASCLDACEYEPKYAFFRGGLFWAFRMIWNMLSLSLPLSYELKYALLSEAFFSMEVSMIWNMLSLPSSLVWAQICSLFPRLSLSLSLSLCLSLSLSFRHTHTHTHTHTHNHSHATCKIHTHTTEVERRICCTRPFFLGWCSFLR